MVGDHALIVCIFPLRRLELFVHDLKCIGHRIVLPFQSTETSQDRVIDSLDQDDSVEGVKLFLFQIRVPLLNVSWNLWQELFGVLLCPLYVSHAESPLLSISNWSPFTWCQACSLRNRCLSGVDLASIQSTHLAHSSRHVASIAEELKKVGIETHSVLMDVATLCVVLLALLEEDGEAREPIEALGTEVRHLCASDHCMGHGCSWQGIILHLLGHVNPTLIPVVTCLALVTTLLISELLA